uniref:Protein LURP-one-related 8 n=1 Tax=Aegilops tauschii subsp. strangulata TaxID=200361 RepID=A0A453KCK8_AEGTS
MSRIHPSDRGDGARRAARTAAERQRQQPAVYTVWKRSSMGFQGTDGFSVYDAAGRLAFRVDNYARRPKAFAGELLLMDGRGAPLLSLRPQIFSLHDRWNCYRVAPGEEGCPDTDRSSSAQQLFSMRKCAALARLPGFAFPSSRLPRRGLLLQEELQDHKERRPGGGTDTEEESRWTYGGSGVVKARRPRRRRVQPGRSAGRRCRHGHGYCRCHGPDLPEALRTNGVLFTVTNSYCTRR